MRRLKLAAAQLCLGSALAAPAACVSNPGKAQLLTYSVCEVALHPQRFSGRVVRIAGTLTTDQLHSVFSDRRCPGRGLSHRIGDMPPARRDDLNAYLASKGIGGGGFKEIDIILIGTVGPYGDFGGSEVAASDFSEP